MSYEGIRNPVYGTCEECGKKAAWEKDGEPEIFAVDFGMGDYRNVCERCADAQAERERSYLEDEDEE